MRLVVRTGCGRTAGGAKHRFTTLRIVEQLEAIEALAGERRLTPETLQVLWNELGTDTATRELEGARTAVDRKLGEPKLRRPLAAERGEIAGKARRATERLVTQDVDETLLIDERRVQALELAF
jgi:hypothetical protein